MRRWSPPAWSVVLIAAALLLWPALVAGRPLVFYDTDGYRSAGASVLSLVWRLGARVMGAEGPLIHEMSLFAPWSNQALDFMGARSPYYGMFLVLSSTVGTLWLTLYLQGLIASWGVWTWLRAAAPAAGPRVYLAVMAVLSAGTALPFYVSFLMPDLFTAVGLLSAVLLLVYPDRLGRPSRAAAWLVLAAALTFHTSNLLAVAGVLAVAALAVAVRSGLPSAVRRCAPLAAALVAAVAAVAAYPIGVRALPGDLKLNNPPFLTARVLADGPGRLHLAEACAAGRPDTLCDYKNRDLSDADVFLWESAENGGVYSASNTPARMRLLDEQLRFVLDTVKRAPLQQLGASLANWARQLASFEVVEPIVAQGQILADPYGAAKVVPGAGACAADPAACDAPFAVAPLKLMHGLVLLLAAGFVGWRLTRPDARAAVRAAVRAEPDNGEAGRTVAAAVLVLGFLVLNAAVGGVLSGPAPRYEARVVWLLPALAGVAALALPRVPFELPARLKRLDYPLARFAVVGGTGFVIDAALTLLLVHGAGLHAFTARLISFSVAVTFTWLLNRYWTFVERRSRRRVKEAARYLLVQGLGAAANLGAYALVLTLIPDLKAWLIVPLACGAAAGLCVTFVGSARFVFARGPAG